MIFFITRHTHTLVFSRSWCAGRRRFIRVRNIHSLNRRVLFLEYLQTHTDRFKFALAGHTFLCTRAISCEEEASVITRLANFVLLCIWALNEVEVQSGSSCGVYLRDFSTFSLDYFWTTHSKSTLNAIKRISHFVKHQSTPGVHSDG